LNDLGQRTSMQMEFGSPSSFDSTWNYQYDPLGQLSNAWKTANGTVVPGRQYGYQFDDIGNRTQTTRGNNSSGLLTGPNPVVTADYTANLLNQYSHRTVPAYAEISGLATNGSVLSFKNEDSGDFIRAGRNETWFHAMMPLTDNSITGTTNEVRMTAVLPQAGTNDLINTNQTFDLSVQKSPEIFEYDDDGNMLSDGKFTYTWNGENRLVVVSNSTGLVAEYAYDYRGRRVSKTARSETTTFLWDGNHIVGEYSSSKTNVYTWGNNDQLVSASLNGTNVFYAHDGNKNVTDLADVGGDVIAHYEFDPFGNTVVKTGELADENPFRFSNEYYDPETGFVAYMRRYLNAVAGAWLNRDPFGQKNGVDPESLLEGPNIYAFVGNNPVNDFDMHGLYTLNDAKNSICERKCSSIGSGRARTRCVEKCRMGLEKKEIFEEWYKLEANNQYFWFVLPKCPQKLCKQGDKFVRPKKDQKLWREPEQKKKGSPEENLHPGMVWSMRSVKLNGSSNQCTYDKNGVLFLQPPTAGTVDLVGPVGLSLSHWLHDVQTIYLANELDDGCAMPGISSYPRVREQAGSHVKMYYERRPLYAETEDGYQ
jgi:RHS repeat-associated protein